MRPGEAVSDGNGAPRWNWFGHASYTSWGYDWIGRGLHALRKKSSALPACVRGPSAFLFTVLANREQTLLGADLVHHGEELLATFARTCCLPGAAFSAFKVSPGRGALRAAVLALCCAITIDAASGCSACLRALMLEEMTSVPEITMCWHERTHTDPAATAFRALVRKVVTEVNTWRTARVKAPGRSRSGRQAQRLASNSGRGTARCSRRFPRSRQRSGAAARGVPLGR